MTGQEKFDSCKFRSSQKEPIDGAGIGGGCCGSKAATEGYFCMKHVMVDVTPEICETCSSWKTKITLYGS